VADLADVMTALTTLVSAAVYPAGTSAPSVTGSSILVYPGWPVPNKLNEDITAGKNHITIYATEHEKNTTRHFEDWVEPSPTIPPLSVSVAGRTATFSGTASAGQTVMAIVGNRQVYYTTTSAETLSSVASSLASLITTILPATSAGAVLSVPSASRMAVRVSTTGPILREVSRFERTMQIIAWSPSPSHRTAISRPVALALAKIRFLTLPDGSACRLIVGRSTITDHLEKQGIYRRDMFCNADYAITETAMAPLVTTSALNLGYRDPQHDILTSNR
jgi:hypothetical protein